MKTSNFTQTAQSVAKIAAAAHCRTNAEIIAAVEAAGVLSERDILNLVHRANRETYHENYKSVAGVRDAIETATGCSLTNEQTAKGLEWLNNYVWKKNGDERKNNTLNNYEMNVLNNFKRFYFSGVENIGGSWGAYYVPVWGVESKSGETFEYYLNGGKVVTL